MLNATFARVAEQDLPRLRAWLAELPERREELVESYRREGTRHELFFVIRARPSPIVVLITEVADLEHAVVSFLRSNQPLGLEFKSLVQDIAAAESDVELLFDSATVVPELPRTGRE
jgi:hypothetical protein